MLTFWGHVHREDLRRRWKKSSRLFGFYEKLKSSEETQTRVQIEEGSQMMTIEKTFGLFIDLLMVKIRGASLEFNLISRVQSKLESVHATLAFEMHSTRGSHPEASNVTPVFHESSISS